MFWIVLAVLDFQCGQNHGPFLSVVSDLAENSPSQLVLSLQPLSQFRISSWLHPCLAATTDIFSLVIVHV